MSNPELKAEVEILLDEVERTHRYSMSRIYSLWNVVNEKSEKPQSCASCLIRKVRDLKAWLDKERESEPDSTPAEEAPATEKKVRKSARRTDID